MLHKDFLRLCRLIRRKYSVQSKPKITPDGNVVQDLNNEVYKPRRHPGIMKIKVATIPDALFNAIQNVTEDQPVKALLEDSNSLVRYLQSRKPPIEKDSLKEISYTIREKVISRMKDVNIKSEEDQKRFDQSVSTKVQNVLRAKVHNWKPIDYDDYTSLLYLFGRIAPEYAVLLKIFTEISDRDPEFQPKSLFDFGSGVGSATWAAISLWRNSIFEYFNVDASRDMNDLAQLLLQDGRSTKPMMLKGVFYRQFLPASNINYDLVISAYSLLELPSRQSRLETLLNLWNKTGKYLVIVEKGTIDGFQVINEARDYILHTKNVHNAGHVFSPCPHDNVCPKFMNDDNCNFQVHYFTPPFAKVSERKAERYTYIVLKKGERTSTDPQWPRSISETLVRSKHSICRFCTANGTLQEVIFTASKHGKMVYHCARSTKWGDLLPIRIDDEK